MLNEVHLQGVVVRNEQYRGTRLVRIAVAHDPGRNGVGEDSAYITLRVDPPLALVAANLAVGTRIRASGYLIHRDYPLSLTRFAEAAMAEDDEAKGILEELRGLARRAGARVFKPHSATEIVAERLFVEE